MIHQSVSYKKYTGINHKHYWMNPDGKTTGQQAVTVFDLNELGSMTFHAKDYEDGTVLQVSVSISVLIGTEPKRKGHSDE